VFLVSHFTTIVYLETEEAAYNNPQSYRILVKNRQIQNLSETARKVFYFISALSTEFSTCIVLGKEKWWEIVAQW